MIEKSYLLNNTSDKEDIEDMEVFDNESDYLIISDYEVIVLIINDVVNLNHQRFNKMEIIIIFYIVIMILL